MQLVYLNDYGPTPEELEVIGSMHDYPPLTKFGVGDIAALRSIPPKVRWFMEMIPKVWQVRLVVSSFQYEMHAVMHTYPELGLDQATSMVEMSGLSRSKYQNPIVYAHGFPHGHYPNSAHWFPEHCLQRIALRSSHAGWENVLDEFKTPFHGFDPAQLHAGFVFDLAPDRYDAGMDLQRPLSFEEESFHSACLLGLEHHMMIPMESPVLKRGVSLPVRQPLAMVEQWQSLITDFVR